jgi:hypothetical protein
VSGGGRAPDVGAPVAGLGMALDFMRLLWAMDHDLQHCSKRTDARIAVVEELARQDR